MKEPFMSNLRFDRMQAPYGRNRLATAALVLGLVTFGLSLLPTLVIITWTSSLLAVIFGLIAGIPAHLPGRRKALIGAIFGFFGWWLGVVITSIVIANSPTTSTNQATPQPLPSAATQQATSQPTTPASPAPSIKPTSTPTPKSKPTPTAKPSTSTPTPANKVSALSLLNRLVVKPEGSGSGYSRDKFEHWVDANGNGHDTRAEVLAKESQVPITYGSSGGVTRGKWVSAYDGLTFTVAGELDVDHMVPLAEAWRSGANAWSAGRREAYANDLGYGPSLIAVSARENRSKSDSDPTDYLPPRATYVCTYVKNWVAIKSRWKLTLDPTEKQVVQQLLASRCTNPYVAKPGKPKVSSLTGSRVSSGSSSSSSSGSGSSSSGDSSSSNSGGSKPSASTDPQYGTCTELLTHANHAPYKRGVDPEYSWYTDRDSDGFVCE